MRCQEIDNGRYYKSQISKTLVPEDIRITKITTFLLFGQEWLRILDRTFISQRIGWLETAVNENYQRELPITTKSHNIYREWDVDETMRETLPKTLRLWIRTNTDISRFIGCARELPLPPDDTGFLRIHIIDCWTETHEREDHDYVPVAPTKWMIGKVEIRRWKRWDLTATILFIIWVLVSSFLWRVFTENEMPRDW